jgi:XTP/dITP diphosphohydrolase
MRLLIATRNKHKVQEIRSILGEQFEYLSLAEFPEAPDVKEDAETFEGNARKKAMELARWLATRESERRLSAPTLVIADDSGLEVDALGGAPGVLSARYAGKHADYAANNSKLLEAMKSVPNEKRTGRFRCVLAVASLDGEVRISEGTCDGHISFEPRGNQGFGYDPLFIPHGHQQTFAELGSEVKDKISHRARALAKARQVLGQVAGQGRKS